MSQPIGNILNYTPEPDANVHRKHTLLLWLVAAISLSMTAIGYIILATLVF